MNFRTKFVVTEGRSLNADRYIRHIVEDHVLSFATLIGDEFSLMREYARWPVERIVTQYRVDDGNKVIE